MRTESIIAIACLAAIAVTLVNELVQLVRSRLRDRAAVEVRIVRVTSPFVEALAETETGLEFGLRDSEYGWPWPTPPAVTGREVARVVL